MEENIVISNTFYDYLIDTSIFLVWLAILILPAWFMRKRASIKSAIKWLLIGLVMGILPFILGDDSSIGGLVSHLLFLDLFGVIICHGFCQGFGGLIHFVTLPFTLMTYFFLGSLIIDAVSMKYNKLGKYKTIILLGIPIITFIILRLFFFKLIY